MERLRFESKKSKRQTVIELLIVLVIILFLAAIAIPDFLKFQAKAMNSENKTYLGQIFRAQAEYHNQHHTYAGGTEAFKLIGWSPDPGYKTLFAYYCGEDFMPNQRGDKIHRSDVPDGVASSATGFTCAAVGNIDNDPDLDVWTVNDQKQFKNEPSDL
jgi:type IV pilus assembly protein PilA